MYARFYECNGEKTSAIIILPENVKGVKAVGFERKQIEEIKVWIRKIYHSATVLFK